MNQHSSEENIESFSLSKLGRHRWNVVDLVSFVGSKALPVYLFCEIDMTKIEAARIQLRKQGLAVTVTAFLLKAIGIAQHAYPEARSMPLSRGGVATFEKIVAGFTVERMVRNKPSVFIGTIEAPDEKSLEAIAADLRNHVQAPVAAVRELDIQQRFSKMFWLVRRMILWLALRFPQIRLLYMPATFGVSSLGKYGIKNVSGPCVSSVTFGVGQVEDRPVVCSGRIEVRSMMSLSLAVDLRVMDAAQATRFLRRIKDLMESGLLEYLPTPSCQAQLVGTGSSAC